MSPLPPELRDGPLSAPDIPEGPHGEDGVVADSRSGYVLRWGRRPKQLPLVPGKPTRGTGVHLPRSKVNVLVDRMFAICC